MNCVIENVAIPLDLSNRFIPPDLKRAIEYYPDFIRHSGLNWSIQAYFCRLLKEIDMAKPSGYDGYKAGSEFLKYYSVINVKRMFFDAEGKVKTVRSKNPLDIIALEKLPEKER